MYSKHFTQNEKSYIIDLTRRFISSSYTNSLQANTQQNKMRHLDKHRNDVSYTPSVAQLEVIMQAFKEILNDNERSYSKLNDIDNETSKIERSKEVDRIADRLVSEFDSELSRPFYCKCAWNLPAPIIERLMGEAKEMGKNPGALFNHLARKEMLK